MPLSRRTLLLSSLPLLAQQPPRLSAKTLKLQGGEAADVTYRGRRAVRVTGSAGQDALALLPGVTLGDGTIEADLAGAPGAGASEAARGFVGVAFRMETPERYECFYLRPTNGRAEDQVRRNHSAQYVSHPDWPWQRLRKEFPERYESYVDLEPGAWTPVRITVQGTQARLYVHGAAQPCLVVNDLKLGGTPGGVALWLGPGTEAHFANLRVTPK